MSRMLRPALLSALVLAATPVLAQGLGGSALKGHDTNAPIDIDAQRIEVRDKENVAIFSGAVKAKQQDMNLAAAELRVFYEKGAGGNPTILRIDAKGGFSLVSPSERATSSYGVYDVDQRVLTMIGGVVLNRGDSVLRGQRLTIDLDSGRSTLDGASSGGSTSASSGRVTGRFVVPQRTGK